MTTIIYCHPSTDSFSHTILTSITDALTARGEEYYVINLYGEGFNPVLDSAGLSGYTEGTTHDEMASRYATALARSRKVIMVFPIWWGVMPAMLKGFFDKVYLKGTVFDFTPEGNILPCLSIDSTTVITTSQEPTSELEAFMQGYFTPNMLNAVGMNNVKWLNFEHIHSADPAHRKGFLADVLATVMK